jgi:hypothetical protein
MKEIFRHKKLLRLTAVILVIVAAAGFWQYHTNPSVEASGVVSIDIGSGLSVSPGLDAYTTRAVTEKSTNFYEIDYPGSGSKIEIGDVSKTGKFKPDLTISTWNREAEFKLIAASNAQEKAQLASSLVSDAISASNGEWTFKYSPVAPKSGFNDKGGVDILITAKVKPASNKISFTYDSSTVTPYYQPPLTSEYKVGWSDEFQCEISVTETQVTVSKETKELKAGTVLVERPDYVVGSIAFYADGKANNKTGGVNYATGKVGNLYAMKCNGQWCRWTIEGQNIVLTIPLEVFDKAVYPLVISPVGDTFGYTTAGASGILGTSSTNFYASSPYTAAAGTGTSMSFYGYASGGSPNVQMALYSDNGNWVGTKVGNTNSVAITSATPQWWTANFVGNPAVSAISTRLAFSASADWTTGFCYDTGAPANIANVGSQTFGTWGTNINWSNYGQPFKMSIYCTYTPAGGYSISNTPSSVNLGAVNPSNTISTGLNYFSVTNNSSSAVKITISGTDITGGTTWTLSDTATPGVGIVGMKAGLNGGSYNIIVKKTATFNTLISNLAASASQGWGLQLLSPTNYTDSVQKAGTVMLTASAP